MASVAYLASLASLASVASVLTVGSAGLSGMRAALPDSMAAWTGSVAEGVAVVDAARAVGMTVPFVLGVGARESEAIVAGGDDGDAVAVAGGDGEGSGDPDGDGMVGKCRCRATWSAI